MRFDVVTLFEELFAPFLATGMVGRAVREGAVRVRFKSPRDFGLGAHRAVDDKPYGGGAGMVMRADCIVSALEALDVEAAAEARAAEAEAGSEARAVEARAAEAEAESEARAVGARAAEAGAAAGEVEAAGGARAGAGGEPAYRVLLSPQGRPFHQRVAEELCARPAVALICGRYEGVDERVRSYVDEEISLGDFVLSGGEVAAMVVIDACARLLPGVLGNAASLEQESHSAATEGLLEYPQYTRPPEFRGARVPEVLLSGHHGRIAAWRQQQAEQRTRSRRPDLAQVQEAQRADLAQGPKRAQRIAHAPQPVSKQVQPKSKQVQPTSKQVQPKSKQVQPTSKQVQPKSMQGQAAEGRAEEGV